MCIRDRCIEKGNWENIVLKNGPFNVLDDYEEFCDIRLCLSITTDVLNIKICLLYTSNMRQICSVCQINTQHIAAVLYHLLHLVILCTL